MSWGRNRPKWVTGEGKRPKCIGTKTIIVDGKEVKVRVFEPAGVIVGMQTPGMCKNSHHVGLNRNLAAQAVAAEERANKSMREHVSGNSKRRMRG